MLGICHTWLAISETSPKQMQLHRSEKGRSLVNPIQVTSNFTKINRIKKVVQLGSAKDKGLVLGARGFSVLPAEISSGERAAGLQFLWKP